MGPADDEALAAELATAAGALLLTVRDEVGFGDPRGLRDAGDARSQDLLAAAFAARRPGDAVLSEEAADDPARLVAPRVWIVDPLDGTREFGEPGRTDWAVHVALWIAGSNGATAGSGDTAGNGITAGNGAAAGNGATAGNGPADAGIGRLVAGAVALPALGVTLSTGGSFPKPGPLAERPRIVASRSRAPEITGRVAAALRGVVVPMGSAGAKVAAVVRGEVDVYVHAGGQYEWDSAAPVAVARAAGLHTSRLDGSPLVYNRPDPLLPDLLVCRPELAAAVLAVTA